MIPLVLLAAAAAALPPAAGPTPKPEPAPVASPAGPAAATAATPASPPGASPANPPTAADAKRAGRDAKNLEWFTDTPVVAQDGTPQRFYTDLLRGQVVLIAFIYTNCGDACPLITAKMNAVRTALGDAFGERVRFVSISVDPENDDPPALAEFARKHGAAHAGWKFVSGKVDDVHLVLQRLGQATGDPAEHNTGFVAGNFRTNHFMKLRPDVPPGVVAGYLRNLADEDAATAARP